MYVLLSGCLGTYAPKGGDRRRFLARVVAGETVGEMGILSGKPRTADVIALRDSELGRLSRDAFDRIVRSHPEAMYRIAQITVQRLEASTAMPRPRMHGPRTCHIGVKGTGMSADHFVAGRKPDQDVFPDDPDACVIGQGKPALCEPALRRSCLQSSF